MRHGFRCFLILNAYGSSRCGVGAEAVGESRRGRASAQGQASRRGWASRRHRCWTGIWRDGRDLGSRCHSTDSRARPLIWTPPTQTILPMGNAFMPGRPCCAEVPAGSPRFGARDHRPAARLIERWNRAAAAGEVSASWANAPFPLSSDSYRNLNLPRIPTVCSAAPSALSRRVPSMRRPSPEPRL